MKHKNFQTQEDPFAKNAQDISKTYHEGISLMKFLQTTPQVKNMKNIYYDSYYAVIKGRDDKDIIADENEYINFNDIITPNLYIGIKLLETIIG